MQDRVQALVVDSDTRAVLALVRALSEQGYVVGAALTGADGLEEIERHDYDLVLAGAELPDLAGFAGNVRSTLPDARLVLIGSGQDLPEGFSAAVTPPGDADAAADAVDAMLDSLAEAEAHERRARTGRVPLRELKGWRKVARVAINIALFLIGPFVALSYMLALPFVGVYSFLKTTLAGWQQKGGPRASGSTD